MTTLQNELARIRIDTLNTAAHNEQLKSQLNSVLDMLKEREKLIDKYEVEIRRRNDELEKKQAFVDSLNRKYDALTSNVTVRSLLRVCENESERVCLCPMEVCVRVLSRGSSLWST